MKAQLKPLPPGWTIIVDPDAEYSAFGLRCTSLAELVKRVNSAPAGCVRFVASDDRKVAEKQFDFLCANAWQLAERGAVTFVVDELAEFTRPAWAPFWWRRLVRRGRKRGMSIKAASQRPAEIDKTIFSNASLVRVGRLNFPDDRVVCAAAVGVAVDQVGQLGQLDYLERDYNLGELRRGRLTF